jgi:hypothetical protein
MKIRPVLAGLLLSDRRTDGHEEATIHLPQFCIKDQEIKAQKLLSGVQAFVV